MPVVVSARIVECPTEACAAPVGEPCRGTLHEDHFSRHALAVEKHQEDEDDDRA